MASKCFLNKVEQDVFMRLIRQFSPPSKKPPQCGRWFWELPQALMGKKTNLPYKEDKARGTS